jgi:hypothetical protein
MYKLINISNKNYVTLTNGDSVTSIPFDPANTDYQRFKKDVNEGAELQDAEGNVLPSEEAKEFIKTLP